MRVPLSLAAAVLAAGCGVQALELFPGNGTSGPDAGGVADATANGADGDEGEDALNPSLLGDADAGTDAAFDGGAVESGIFEGGCQSNSDCPAHGENRFCQTGLHVCVQCLGGPNDCAGQGSESACNLVNYSCAVPCAPGGGCPPQNVCDSQGVCTDCVDSTQCPSNQPRCINEDCVCLTNADCPAGQKCDSDQTCR